MGLINEIIIIKLGGSFLTDKTKPFSIREDAVERAIDEIIKSQQKAILIHGGGSFGHPVARKYQISGGYNASMKNQILGLAETHEAMTRLNSYLINKFLERDFPAISIQTSSIFIKDSNKISTISVDPIETSLDLGILPILYGDIILDTSGSFSIISGDTVILELCKNLKRFSILKVVFAIEEDGIFIKENKDGKEHVKLATEIKDNELDYLALADFDDRIDVTGGLKGKLDIIKKISELKLPVQIINGLKEDNILKALKLQDLVSTTVKITSGRSPLDILRDRKLDHLKIPIVHDVQHSENYFNYIKLKHHPLPEIDFDDIDLSIDFFKKKISAPICIAAITGGHSVSKEINKILAQAAENENIIMSVGSQRAGLVDPKLMDSFSIVRDVALKIPIIGNIGIGQLSNHDFDPDDFKRCIEMVKADAMAIHFNALHELVQEKGDRSYKNFIENFKEIRKSTNIPIIAKEVGSGFNQELAITLDKLGFDGFDVGGAGGTSFAAIESLRNDISSNQFTRNLAETFREWGIPTPASVYNVRKVTNKLIIATGGLRNGVDIAKSISLGADIGGFAYKFLLTSWNDYKKNSITNTVKEIKTLKNELKSCLWLLNLITIDNLKSNKDKRIILRKLRPWIRKN